MKTSLRTLVLNIILVQLIAGPLATSRAQADAALDTQQRLVSQGAQKSGQKSPAAKRKLRAVNGQAQSANVAPQTVPQAAPQTAAQVQAAQAQALYQQYAQQYAQQATGKPGTPTTFTPQNQSQAPAPNLGDPSTAPLIPTDDEIEKFISRVGPEEQKVMREFIANQKLGAAGNHAGMPQPGVLSGGGHVLVGWLNLAAGMWISEAFGVLTSGDPSRMKAYFEQMTSIEFWVQMAVFEGAMKVSRTTLAAAMSRPAENLGFFDHLILPMGDFITSSLMGVYQDPHMQAMIKTWDPHTMVRDPENPNSKPTNDPAMRMKVRQHLQRALAIQILIDSTRPKTLLGNFYHAFQMGVVAWTFGNLQGAVKQYSMMFFKREITADGALRIVVSPGSFNKLAGVAAEGGSKFEFQLIKSVNLAKFAEWMESTSKGTSLVKGANGLVSGGISTALFFALDHFTTDAIMPTWKNYNGKWDIDKAQKSLDDAIAWYTDPNRKEVFPMSRLKSSHETTMLQFFLNGGNFESDEFKANKDNWHKGYNSVIGQPWKQIFKFMSDVSETYLATSVDSDGFYGCFEMPSSFSPISLVSSTIMARQNTNTCHENWVRKNTPAFVASLKKFQAIDYVQARANAVFTAYESYRSSVILAPMWETWQRWSKDIESRADMRTRKDQWFEWIAAGMKEDDPAFLENLNAWHIHPDDRSNYWLEKVNYVIAFDREVLHMENNPSQLSHFEQVLNNGMSKALGVFHLHVNGPSFRQVEDCGGAPAVYSAIGKVFHTASADAYQNCVTKEGDIAFQNHEINVRAFLNSYTAPVTHDTLYSMIHFAHTDAFRSSSDVTKNGSIAPEAAQVLASLIQNRFQPKSQAETEDAQMRDQLAEKRYIVRWFWQGLSDQSDEYKENKNNWRHVGDDPAQSTQYLADAGNKYFMAPFFNQSQNYYNVPVLEQLGTDIAHLLKRDNQPIAQESRDRILLVAKTYDELEKEHAQINEEIKLANAKYISVINYISHEVGWEDRAFTGVRSWWSNLYDDNFNPKTPGTLERLVNKNDSSDKFYSDGRTLFNRGGLNNEYWIETRTRQMGRIFGTNLPLGTINVYNMELGFYLSRLEQALSRFRISDAAVANNAEFAGLTSAQPQVFAGLAQLIDSLAGLKDDPNFSANDPVLNQSVASSLNSAEIIFNASTDNQAKQLAQKVARDLNKASKDAGLNALSLRTQGAANEFKALAQARNAVAKQMKDRVADIENEIKQRGASQATADGEGKLLRMLGTANFSVPLLGATAGADTPATGLVRTLTARIINTENQKLIQSRIGCFLLNDPACDSNKRARVQ